MLGSHTPESPPNTPKSSDAARSCHPCSLSSTSEACVPEWAGKHKEKWRRHNGPTVKKQARRGEMNHSLSNVVALKRPCASPRRNAMPLLRMRRWHIDVPEQEVGAQLFVCAIGSLGHSPRNGHPPLDLRFYSPRVTKYTSHPEGTYTKKIKMPKSHKLTFLTTEQRRGTRPVDDHKAPGGSGPFQIQSRSPFRLSSLTALCLPLRPQPSRAVVLLRWFHCVDCTETSSSGCSPASELSRAQISRLANRCKPNSSLFKQCNPDKCFAALSCTPSIQPFACSVCCCHFCFVNCSERAMLPLLFDRRFGGGSQGVIERRSWDITCATALPPACGDHIMCVQTRSRDSERV